MDLAVETDFVSLSQSNLIAINGGLNWDNLVGGVVTAGGIVGIFVPPVGIAAGLFGTSYYLTRAFS